MYYNILQIKNNIKACHGRRGFSTVEMLIAMSILVISLSAIILISFGTQTVLIDSQTNSEAINLAQEFLEKEQTLARKDFKLVNPRAITSVDIYKIKVDVEPQADFLTKKVTATVSWPDQYNRGLNVKLSAIIANFENAVGGDTCNSVLSGDWAHPAITNIPVGDTSGNASLSVDAYKQKLYVTISEADASTSPTLFVYSLADPQNPVLISSIDNDPLTEDGINDIHATDGYLYAAKAIGPGNGQMQIFNISAAAPSQVGSDFLANGATGVGNSIFYKDGYVYLGLTADSGSEFYIIDVHNPYVPPFEVGRWLLGSTINDIYAKGNRVYLATADTRELIVLKINDPTNPSRIDSFDVPDLGDGKKIYLVGDTLYLGKTVDSGNPELYMLDNPEFSVISASSSWEISESVNGLLVRENLAFLTTDSQFQIWDMNDSSAIPVFSSPLVGTGNSLDCEGNYLYAGSVDTSNNKAYLSVIYTP
jgi:type II secretory pathway pseudopilin PulG